MKTKNILAGLVLASSGFLSMAASAAIIPEWDWVTDGGFVVGGATCSNGSEAACQLGYNETGAVTPSGIAGTSSVMTWGVPASTGNGNQSGLQAVFGANGTGPHEAALLGSSPVTIPAFEKIVTNGDWTNTGAAIHYNNVITAADGHMATSELVTSFELTSPVGIPFGVVPLSITFTETYNESLVRNCPPPNPHGTKCDDIFTVTPLPGSITFYVGGQLYKLSFRYLAGPGAILDGDSVYTKEKSPGTSVLFTQARITTIPAPGVLALLGMGLLMLGWRIRKTA
ncbi:MAG: THxN family PEP-CTERM protein [Porticoccaceae bacterium]